ncbi:ligand-binding sensor domain-containing diguanylate cyclase [Natronospira bacteriovora]|uniref:diguanylate cyclase n=1 Tax=Natronospira bacteriovora TaxID=3069753 RepID=A0ABU0W3I6_9GAMM|nr:ligand-binding sensor domain-containing diguanylate cyclase [Natronospira sp. AB-CW4]MDQ2068577.1 diguanylate cyclase [Natronospira sp. AB-CW4]
MTGFRHSGSSPRPATFLLSLIMPALLFPAVASALPPEIPPHQLLEQRWAVPEGMPQTTAQVVIESRSGALWIGTQNGLARFDGIRFDRFRAEDHPGLSHDYINALHEDASGRLWLATEQGLSLFEHGRFDAPEGHDMTGPIRSLVATGDGSGVWLASENGLFLATPERVERHPTIQSPLFSVTANDDGRVIVGGRGEIWVLQEDRSRQFSFPAADRDLEVRTLLVHEGQLYQGLSNGLRRAPLDHPLDWEWSALTDRELESLLVDDAGSLWIATESGLFRQTPADQQPRNVRTRDLTEREWLRHLMQDSQGNLWIGTQARGVVRLSTGAFRRHGELDGLVDDIIWSLFEDPDGAVWAGTNEFGAFRMQDGQWSQFADADELPHGMVMGFLLDRTNRFWIATRGGLAWYHWPSLEPMPTPADLPRGGVFGITEDRDGRIWIATREGLFWWQAGHLERIRDDQGLTQQRTRDVLEDQEGRIWVATDTGIFRGGVDSFEAMGKGSGLDDYSASALFELNGTVWGMLQGALVRFVNDEARIYPDGHGLRATVSSYMILDEDDYIWTTTHEGIQRLPLSQFDEYDRDERDTFEADLFGRLTDPEPAQCNGGHGQAGLFQPSLKLFWCPSLNGALSLNLAAAMSVTEAPSPRLRTLRSGGEIHDLGLSRHGEVTLPPHARDLEIDFIGLHFRYPEGVSYRYRLTGFDSDWQAVGDRRTAFYTNLPPGEYRFELQALNERGRVSDETAILGIRMTPRFHETVGFRLLMGVVMLLAAYGAWRYSVRQLHRRRALLEQMVRKRTRQLDELNRQLHQASVTDPLTGLRNRRYLSNQLPHDVAQVERAYTRASDFPNRDITFLMVDLDHFKRINDVCGHRVGDQVLSQFAEILASQVRDSDYVIRWGGEEFLIVARNSERDKASACAARIIAAVRAHRFMTDQGELECSCSIGVTCYPALAEYPDAINWEEVIELADAANYIAKDEGRDRWVEITVLPDVERPGFMQRFRQQGAMAVSEAGEISLRREKPASDAGNP